ncbi:COQ9 family protein [Falsirhodobacter xinxiangensis]|uniref:COQ9 family protein n=1 Tax=Falsirhodobacter xinxiangensis TaxID=2530049 RepID=UPI0010AAB0DA|nr:COQ9 family protein [Rhodobacter xinxiangensis]
MESTEAKNAVLDAALAHVAFDGWSETTLRAASADAGVAPGLARALFPRGAVDLALAYHHRGDAEMVERAGMADLPSRITDKVATLIRYRLEAADREAVRRGSTLFALPQHAGDGAKAIWGTADAIWTALGDSSDDVNWYTKRATLSAVYGATVLYWLGDDSPDHHATWEFLDRRLEGVMRFEKMKARFAGNPLAKAAAMPFSWIKAPRGNDDLPGRTR